MGELTAVVILAETNGFELIRNKKLLTSYASFDVKEKQSGTSVKGKPISKKGNRSLRKAMYLQSLSAVKWDDNFINMFVRIVPTIVFAISSVPVYLGPSASAICLAVRFLGFCISISIINYFELNERSRHYNAFQDLTLTKPLVRDTMEKYAHNLLDKGMLHSHTLKTSQKLLVNAVHQQSQIRFAMDYYELMIWKLTSVIILVALFPYLIKQ